MKKLLFKALDLKSYLRVLHLSFHFLYAVGALKRNYTYRFHYFDAKVIKEGDHVMDIGANLGYYTKLFAKWVGKTGAVYAVEPVPAFADTIKNEMKEYNNVTIYNFALGSQERDVTLSTPGRYGYLRTGLAKVQSEKEAETSEFSFKAVMKCGSKLFQNLKRLDFIKCDIEGYEAVVLPEMKPVLEKFKPMIQLETWGNQKAMVENFLLCMGYNEYDLEGENLKQVTSPEYEITGDLFFIHPDNKVMIGRFKNVLFPAA